MAGIGDSWGTREELLHPRGPDGRWIRKAGIAKGIIEAVLGFLSNFRPRQFQNRNQASQYLHNVAGRQGRRRMQRGDQVRLSRDLAATNADLRDGVIDEPSTKTFVDMMDRSATELPDDVILTRIVGPDAFGFTPETAKGTSSDTDPGIRGMSGKLIADRGYGLTTIGGPQGPAPAGSVRMVIAAKKGTKVTVPATGPTDTTVFLDRGQPMRVTKVAPDGAGGWTMYVTAEPGGGRAFDPSTRIPESIAGPVGEGRRPSKEREASIRQSMQELARIDKTPDEQKEQADIEARQRAAEANAQVTPVPSPQQETERRRLEAQQAPQQPAPGEPAPRTETPVGRVGEPGTSAPGGAPAQTPGATVPEAPTVPRRSVDLRLAVRDAKIPSPSAGSRRKQWNEAYLGVASGKKDPVDAIRELDSDIETLRRGGEPGGGPRGGLEEDRDRDIAAFQQLRDLMAREYGLPESEKAPEPRTKAGLPKAERPQPVKTRLSKREQEAEERNRAAAEAEAPPAPTPVKKAPAKKAPASRGPQSEARKERLRQAREAGFRGAGMSDDEIDSELARRRGGVLLQGETPVLKRGAKTAARAAKKAIGPVRTKDQEDRILSQASKLSGPPRNDEERRILDEAAEISARRQGGVTARRQAGTSTEQESPMKVFAKKAPAKAAKKAAPEAPGDDLDKMTKRELIAEAGRRGVIARESWTKDRIKQAMLDREAAGAQAPEAPAPVKKAAPRKLNSRNLNPGDRVIWQPPGETPVHGVVDQQGTRTFVNWEGGRRERVTSTGDGGMGPNVRLATPEEVEEHGTLGPPREEPRAPAAKAAVPGAAPGTAAGKITAGRLQPGMRILVGQNNGHTTRKTGAKVATITSIDRFSQGGRTRSQTRIQINAVDEDGRPFIVGQGDAVVRSDRVGFSPSQTFMVAPEPGAAPAKKAAKAAAPDKVQVARARQEEIFDRKRYSDTASELDQLIADEASDKAILSRFDNTTQREGVPGGAMDAVRARLEAGDRDGARREMRRILEANGVQATGNAGDIVPFNRREHAEIAGTSIADGDMVRIVRPGHRTRIRDEDVDLGRSVVEPATPAEVTTAEKAKRLVPEGSVPGARTSTPVDNAPRKRELRKAWIAADIQPPPGPVRTQTEEIRDKLLNGDVTPEEGIRMMESEIALNKEDLAELDAHLREADLTDRERKEFQDRAVKLTEGIREQEKAAKFLKLYFKGEAPVVSLKEAKEIDPVSYEFLKDATPDDMREAAKEAGLDAPSGDTPDEMFTDLIKQVAKKELDRGAAKKAAKKAAPAKVAKKAAPAPAVPKEKERVDARLLAEGIEGLDDDVVQRVQGYLDGEEVPGSGKNQSPAKIADWLNSTGRRIRDSAAIRYGGWHDRLNPDSPQYDPEFAEQMRLDRARAVARAQAFEELAGRVRGIRRRSVKKAAPATPEVAKLQDKVDDLEKRRIDDALKELTGAKSKEQRDAALEGLTLPELRRLAEQAGVGHARTWRSKLGVREGIIAHFFPQQPIDVHSLGDLPSREAAHELLAPLGKPELLRMARELSVPGAGSKNMTQLRSEIVEATTGRRLDSIAIRGFKGPSPEVPEPATSRTPSLSARARAAGIDSPSELFSDVDSAVSEADRRLQMGDWSPNEAAKFLRERAAQVAKADIMEEGRRFRVEHDKDSLLSIRKSSAEYLRRVATHVQQEAKERRAAKKAPAKKAAPELPPPGEFLELARTERPFTEPSPSRTGTSPVGGTKSTAPEIKNNWGMLGTGGEVEFHDDGVIGQRLRQMGDDRLMDVDGEPLSNVIGKLATRAIRGEISQEQLLMDLDRLYKRLPAGSRAKGQVKSMMEDLDAPARPMPDLPDGAPAPFRTAIEKLLQIPLARDAVDRPGFHRDRENSEVDKLLRLLEEFNEGRTGGLRFINEIMNMRTGLPHESQEGRFEIDRVLRDLHAELDRMYKNPELRPQLMPRERGTRAPKKATPRLTAIPGGGTGRGGGKRPKLTVVRNEQGEFAVAWV